jgi:fructose-1,6-bisphosphatase/inositol monophosphatase family enzyme
MTQPGASILALEAAHASLADTFGTAHAIQEELREQRAVLVRSSVTLGATGTAVDRARLVARRMAVRESRLYVCAAVGMCVLVTGAVAGLVYFAMSA